MQFRSGNFWFGCLSRAILLGTISTFLLVLSAGATITVTPVDSWGNNLSNVIATSNIAYYPAGPYADDTAVPPGYFRDTADSTIPSVINVTSGQASVTSFDRNELVYFSMTSSIKALTPPSGGYVIVFVTAQGTNGEKPVPIAFVGDAAGNGGLCPTVSGCLSQNTNSTNGFNYYFSYNYKPGSTVLLGFFPIDICINYTHFYGGTARGCGGFDGNSVRVNETNTADAMQLNFYVSTLTNAGTAGGSLVLSNMLTTPNPADKSMNVSSIIFENVTSSPTFTCPSMIDLYRPGDGEIFMDSARFSKSVADLVAPITHVIVIGNEGTAPVLTQPYNQANSIAARVSLGMMQSVGGFANTTDGTNHQYNIAFMVRDAAGMVATGSGNCAIPGAVQTSQIQGFLAKSNCFIATAAYRSNNAGPVMMLRQFRDTILMKSAPGRVFVNWYYHWSPSAAEWLMKNSGFRYPVLIALIPVEIVAWSFLHPSMIGWVILLGIALKLFWFIKSSRAFSNIFLGSGILFLILGSSTQAQAEQPYINQILKDLPTQESSGSYIDSVRNSLPPKESEGSFIENLKREHPEIFEQSPKGSSWLEEQAQQVPPKEIGGAITAFHEGKSELQPRYEGEIHHTFGIRYGASIVRDIGASPDFVLRPFDQVYGEHYVPDLTIFFEYQFLRHERIASLGILGSVGASYFHGQGTLKYDLVKPWAPTESFGQGAGTLFQFYAIPVTAALAYRLNLFHYFRPFVIAGPSAILYFESRKDLQKGNRGFSKGLYTSVGVSILMDWLSSKESWDSYQGWGVRHSYLTVEYGRTSSLGNFIDFSVSGFWAGVAFEY